MTHVARVAASGPTHGYEANARECRTWEDNVVAIRARLEDIELARKYELARMPPARVIAGPRALLTSILLVTRVPCREGGWRANPRTRNNAWRH
jgi:hypothetical protein